MRGSGVQFPPAAPIKPTSYDRSARGSADTNVPAEWSSDRCRNWDAGCPVRARALAATPGDIGANHRG